MAKIEKSIIIDAPVDKVFEFMVDPANLPEIWPSLVEVKDVKQTPEGVGSPRSSFPPIARRIHGNEFR